MNDQDERLRRFARFELKYFAIALLAIIGLAQLVKPLLH